MRRDLREEVPHADCEAGPDREPQVREDVRASVVQNKLYTKVTADVTVEDSDIDDYYKKNKEQYVQPESRDVRHILVKKKALADDLYQQLKSGANFAALAKKYSQDPGSKASGGKLTISKGRQVPEFDKAAFALAVHAALAADQDAVRLAHHRGAHRRPRRRPRLHCPRSAPRSSSSSSSRRSRRR